MTKKSFKGGLDSLLGGGPSQEKPPAAAESVENTSIQRVAKKRGRPRTNNREIEKTSQEGCKEAETRATFIVNEGDLERIKAVAYWDRVQIKDAINAALREYIERYEAKNGPLQPKPENR